MRKGHVSFFSRPLGVSQNRIGPLNWHGDSFWFPFAKMVPKSHVESSKKRRPESERVGWIGWEVLQGLKDSGKKTVFVIPVSQVGTHGATHTVQGPKRPSVLGLSLLSP